MIAGGDGCDAHKLTGIICQAVCYRMGIVWQRLGSLSRPTLLLFRLAFERKHFRLASLEWILFHNLSSLLSAVRRNPVEMDKPKSESANLEFEWLRNIQIDRLQLTRFQVKIEKDISKQNKPNNISLCWKPGTNSNLFSLRRQVKTFVSARLNPSSVADCRLMWGIHLVVLESLNNSQRFFLLVTIWRKVHQRKVHVQRRKRNSIQKHIKKRPNSSAKYDVRLF